MDIGFCEQRNIDYEIETHILMQSDDAYSVPMGVAIYSVLTNGKLQNVILHLIDNGISIENRKHIEKIIFDNGAEVDWINGGSIEELLKNSGVKTQRNSYTTYMKLFVADGIKARYPAADKLLYLDCDVLICGPIAELFERNLGENDISAVFEYTHKKYRDNMNLSTNSVNAGVILIDLEKWVARKREKQILGLLKDKNYVERLWLHDQDIINSVFENRIDCLSPKYNMNHAFYYCHNSVKYAPKFDMRFDFYSNEEIDSAIDDMRIIHYMDVCWNGMPWDEYNANIFSTRFYEIKRVCWEDGQVKKKPKSIRRKLGKNVLIFLIKHLSRDSVAFLYFCTSKMIVDSHIV